jgi:hypothetical protein
MLRELQNDTNQLFGCSSFLWHFGREDTPIFMTDFITEPAVVSHEYSADFVLAV